MPKYSENLNLRLDDPVADVSQSSKNWFEANFGYTDSNMTKIDSAYKTMKDDIDNTPTKSGVGATGDWNINVTGSANSAVHDGAGNDISSSYITSISVGNTSITYTKGDGTNQEETIKTDETLSIKGMAADAKATGDRINAIKIETDKTLTISGAAADAKATGDRINAIKIETDKTLTISGAAADAAAVGSIVLPRVVVQTEAGSTVTAVSGDKKVTGTATDGSFSAALPHDGEWEVTATLGTGVATETMQAEYCRTKTLTLTYYALTVTVKAGSTVTAQCGNKTVTGTVPESGSIKLYLPIAGTWTVTATLGDATTEGSVEVSEYRDYPLELAYDHIYGASWDGTSTTKWSRTDEAAEFTDPVPYVAGAKSYGSPFDDRLPWSGMVKSERTGGTMVAIPKFWYKLTQNGSGMSIQIANRAVEGYSVSPAHMDRGDGHGERDVVYIGRYHCNGTYKSGTGSPMADMARSSARSDIHNLGSTIWQSDFTMRFTLWLLYIVEFADWNSQAKIGYGCGNNSSPQSMGYTDSMPYHTGTTQSSRTTYGCGTQYRNIEGLWDNVLDWCDGCYNNGNGLNIILNPSEFSDTSNGTAVGVPSHGWSSAFRVKTNGGFPVFIPTSADGDDTTYLCDNWNFMSSAPCLCVGGCYGNFPHYGLFYVSDYSVSGHGRKTGCRLQELPNGESEGAAAPADNRAVRR